MAHVVLSVGLLWLSQSWTSNAERQRRLKAEFEAKSLKSHFEALGFVFTERDGYREIQYHPDSAQFPLVLMSPQAIVVP